MNPIMLIEEGLYQFLSSNADIAAVTYSGGSPNGAKVYLNAAPESASDPRLIISKISSTPDTTMDGPAGLNFRRYQFTFASADMPTCLRLQETVRQVVEGFSGLLPNGQQVFNIIRDNELDGFDDVTSIHRSLTDYFVQFAD